MANIIRWPAKLLVPARAMASQVAFSRGGGKSLGGIERNIRTDRGFWRVSMTDVSVRTRAMRRVWNTIATDLAGKAGLVAVPVWAFDSAPYPSGEREREALVTFDDDTGFDDDSAFIQGSINVEMATYAPLGATVITVRLINAAAAAGIRFSYQDALYQTGRVLAQPSETTFQVPVFPAIRQAIPAGAQLECDAPTCLCHLSDDRGMDLPLNNTEIDVASVEFVEAVDYWNDLALGVA
ncbi:hypothetical protein VW35_00785 [Devosia soli]|uniref:Uncharacterized protein n=1 Tax=Devosia soli TaxID=361041 RepID=A0A0F5LEJ5_9HYPH|nr:hypothetical protein [Devosia soli]KKB80778.1 hypothetical protein VW35_00785 [Devosia soli]